MIKLFILLFGVFYALQTNAAGTIIVAAVASSAFAATAAGIAIAMAINMVVSAVISKAFFSPQSSSSGFSGSSSNPDPGNRQQIPPATNNRLPVLYGTAYIGGTIVDLSISENNQQLFYVLALSEVTNTNNGQTPDQFTFGDCYFGGKKVLFNSDGFTVRALLDESTGVEDPTVNGKIAFYFYSNGSYSPTNQSLNAIQVMQTPGLIYTWDETKLMSNCAFVIIRLNYSQTANIRGIEQTKFQITNPRNSPGDCFKDYFLNTRYGAAIPEYQLDVDSFIALNNYSNQEFVYRDYEGFDRVQPRFKFNGVIDTSRTIMNSLQDMSTCCDCLIRYDEITGKWGVIVQKPINTPVMDINDSNMVSAIQVTPIDLAASYNVVECKFPDNSNQDAFNTSTFDLSQIAPELLYPNEPVNKMSLTLPLVNNDVQAQYIANRLLKSAREDLQVQASINFVGLQLSAGDIVTLTNANYGWTAKLFRLSKVTQTFQDDGAISVSLLMSEFNGMVYDDANITQFTPAPNTGIGAPDFFGQLYAPVINNLQRSAPTPSFDVNVKVSAYGITQYAEIWYSAVQYPTSDQRLFVGITSVQSSGNPYDTNSLIPPTTVSNVPAGDWYFFSRMVNSIASSDFSLASELFKWRPMTYQFSLRYICVAYADTGTGGGFSLSPRDKIYYGLANSNDANVPTDPSAYLWYLADPPFNPVLTSNEVKHYSVEGAIVQSSQNNYVLFSTRGNRKVSLSIGNAIYFGIGGSFVPSESGIYDQTIWGALEDGSNIIDLDVRSGQNTKFGTSSVSQADGLLNVSNNTSGAMTVALQKFLNFGNGIYSKSFTTQQITIDVYGRVVGFADQDQFYFSEFTYSATEGQTFFSVPTSDGCEALVFVNGVLVPRSEYTSTLLGITFNSPLSTGIVFYAAVMRAVASSNYASSLGISAITRVSNNTLTYDLPPTAIIPIGSGIVFSNQQGAPVSVVSAVDYTNKTITTSTSFPLDIVGKAIFINRSASIPYQPYARLDLSVSKINTFQSTQFYVRNGFEQIYVNGVQFNEIDYDLKNNVFSGFPAPLTGQVECLIFNANNLNIPCSNITNLVTYSVADQTVYPFSSNPQAMQVYANGVNLPKGITMDIIPDNISYSLIHPFPNNATLLNQQTLSRDGAAS